MLPTCFLADPTITNLLPCRPLLSEEAVQEDFNSALRAIMGEEVSKEGILSSTFGRQGQDLQPTAVTGFVGLLKKLHEQGVVSEGAAATERGGKHHWYHVQAMLYCPKLNRNRQDVQEACAKLVYNFVGIPKGQNYHVYAECHCSDEQAHVSWRTMVGCVGCHLRLHTSSSGAYRVTCPPLHHTVVRHCITLATHCITMASHCTTRGSKLVGMS